MPWRIEGTQASRSTRRTRVMVAAALSLVSGGIAVTAVIAGASTTGCRSAAEAPAVLAIDGVPCVGAPAPRPAPCAAPSTGGPPPQAVPSREPPAPPVGVRPAMPRPRPIVPPRLITPPRTKPSAPSAITVWLAGDSTVADPSGGVCPVGWGSLFAPLFTRDVSVRNNAVAGLSIQTWLYGRNVTSRTNAAGECVDRAATYATRWRTMLGRATGMRSGDYLFIQFGINDAATTCPRHVGRARYRQLLGVMAAAAKRRGVHPIFLTPVAAITCGGSIATPNRGFVADTTAAGMADEVPVIDLHRLSYTLYTDLGLCPNGGDYSRGAVGSFFCADHTHFEAAGAAQIARLVAGALRDQRIALADYLR